MLHLLRFQRVASWYQHYSWYNDIHWLQPGGFRHSEPERYRQRLLQILLLQVLLIPFLFPSSPLLSPFLPSSCTPYFSSRTLSFSLPPPPLPHPIYKEGCTLYFFPTLPHLLPIPFSALLPISSSPHLYSSSPHLLFSLFPLLPPPVSPTSAPNGVLLHRYCELLWDHCITQLLVGFPCLYMLYFTSYFTFNF